LHRRLPLQSAFQTFDASVRRVGAVEITAFEASIPVARLSPRSIGALAVGRHWLTLEGETPERSHVLVQLSSNAPIERVMDDALSVSIRRS
jgi:hypothetical protein